MAGLREQQKAATRLRLLDAAEVVFARRGFHGASVDEIAREAGATTGALYANFAGTEDLFLQLLDHTMAQDVRRYSLASGAATTVEEAARAGADRWMQVLSERPESFPLFIEFWAYAVREPGVRERFAERFAAFRLATAAVPDELFGDLLVLVFNGFEALADNATERSGA